MQRCRVKPYEGTQPYVFVSYSHRDKAPVFPILERLSADGFRIWYDEGIDPGSEWISNIAEHLSRASAVISFISPNSAASQNCREEIMFARDSKLPVITIHIEKTEMDSGLKLALMAYQAVFKYSYTNENDFYAKVEDSSFLESCREEVAKPEPKAVDEPVPATPAVSHSKPTPKPKPQPAEPIAKKSTRTKLHRPQACS